MKAIIAAVTQNGVIGLDDKIPFDYPEDMRHFKQKTSGSIVIMGRKTYQGIGKPLPNRRNIVISNIAKGLGTLKEDGIETASSFEQAINLTIDDNRDVWIIGGARLYEMGMDYVDKIVLTITPDYEYGRNAIRFPWINPMKFELESILPIGFKDSKLQIVTYNKIICQQ